MLLVGGADLAGGGQDQAAGAAARVLTELGELHDVAELGRGPELAFADRPCVGVADRDQPVFDRLARETQGDLRADLLGQLGQQSFLFLSRFFGCRYGSLCFLDSFDVLGFGLSQVLDLR